MTTKTKDADLPLAERLRAYLSKTRMEIAGIKNLDPGSKQGQIMHDILVWQEIKAIATAQHDSAWKQALENKCVPTDKEMREAGSKIPGVLRTICSTNHYVCIATVSNPAIRFNMENFIFRLVKKYKIKEDILVGLAEEAKLPSTASLSKKVIQA